MIGSKVYDALKFTAQIFVPALGTLYVALAAIFSWGHVDEVAGTVVAVDTFLGVFVSYLKLKYDASDAKYDGYVNVEEHPSGKKVVALTLSKHEDPADIVNEKTLLFKVEQPD
jgi:hypothetical protein